MYAFESWVHLLRALTTPVTPKDNELKGANWNRGFERLRASVNPPFFAAFFAFWVLRRESPSPSVSCLWCLAPRREEESDV